MMMNDEGEERERERERRCTYKNMFVNARKRITFFFTFFPQKFSRLLGFDRRHPIPDRNRLSLSGLYRSSALHARISHG
jgi:hypothetical protein